MKVIFLDCDGVLNSEEYSLEISETTGKRRGYGGHFREKVNITHEDVLWKQETVDALRSIVDATDAKIVISSTWRIYHSMERFKEMFTLYGWENAPIIDRTKDLGGRKGIFYESSIRGLEINEWINTTKYTITNYVILDDINLFLPDQQEHFVNTHFEIGLTKQDAEQAIKILNDERDY
jgi:HAD domain in Swiss Army Knife RNA repair proteins